jgi:hypothetical protein
LTAFRGYSHVYATQTDVPGYVPSVQFGIKRHDCAMRDCRGDVFSHYPIDRTRRQWWLYCKWHYERLPSDFVIDPVA